MTEYVPLWVKSNFSFLEGASHPDELVEQAHALGLGAIALTDRDGVHGIVRAHMREVPPALKAGNFAKARKSFQNFDDNWDSIEDLIKARNADSYVAIEKSMIAIEKALAPDKPDVAQVTAMVNEVMRLYNAALAEVVKDARERQ